MAKRILVGVLMAFVLLLSSCYPELSVQQYDKLREDIEALDLQRQQLQEEVASLTVLSENLSEANANLKTDNTVTLDYVRFLDKLVSTQTSAKLLEGEFDVDALVVANSGLILAAESLEDPQITHFLGLMVSDNESHTVGVYYKVIEYCVKQMKQRLD
ncbi:hypothetical protein ACFLVU_05710 [Chloroflexota bacterium]